VRDGEEPLDQRQPTVQPLLRVGVAELQLHRLLVIGRGVAVVHQGEVHADTVGEAQQLEMALLRWTMASTAGCHA